MIHSGIALVGPEHMVLNLSEEDINDPESRELTFAANEALKLQAVTTPKVLLGHQVTSCNEKCFTLLKVFVHCVLFLCGSLKPLSFLV